MSRGQCFDLAAKSEFELSLLAARDGYISRTWQERRKTPWMKRRERRHRPMNHSRTVDLNLGALLEEEQRNSFKKKECHACTSVEKQPQASADGQGDKVQGRIPSEQNAAAVLKLYPEMFTRTYTVPPLYFNHVPLFKKQLAGQTVHVMDERPLSVPRNITGSTPVFENQIRFDIAFVRVLRCLQKLGEARQEPMFVVLSLSFQNFIEESAQYEGVCHQPFFLQAGDFDMIIVHRRYGVLICEIMCAGYVPDILLDHSLCRVLKWAALRLDKSEHFVTRHIFEDVVPELTVRKTVILPWIRNSHLHRVLSSDESLRKALCACLGAADAAEASQLCLCADQLSDPSAPHTVTPDMLSRLSAWFDRRLACRVDEKMTDDDYVHMIASLCGPARGPSVPGFTYKEQQVEVKTEADAVSEAGDRMSVPVFSARQVDLLTSAPRLRFLTGPPGTGKSRTLCMMARAWLREGHDVHVVSTTQSSRAVSFLLTHQLQDAVREVSGGQPNPGEVHLHQYRFEEGEIDEAVDGLKSLARGGQLRVIVDEAGPDFIEDAFANFCESLLEQVPDLHLWAATVFKEIRPQCLPEESFTIPCRCPPAVHSEVGKNMHLKNGRIESYSERKTPVPTDGPSVRWLAHSDQPGHSQGDPQDCQMCGHSIADVLARLISSIREDPGELALSDGHSVRLPRRLEYRDVFVLCQSPEEESGVVQGLRSRGFPVRVVKKRDPDHVVQDMALAVRDVVTVADATVITGLERKVVIGVGPIGRCSYSRLLVSSRCTAQLVWIDPEPDT